jgi:hypothetical protein
MKNTAVNFHSKQLQSTNLLSNKSLNGSYITTLFKVKNNLDLLSTCGKNMNHGLIDELQASQLPITFKASLPTKQYTNKYISSLELSLSNNSLEVFNLPSNTSKLTLSENFSKGIIDDMYIFNNVQNSMESAFNLACSKR